MKKTLIVADPEIPCAASCHGIHVSVRDSAYPKKTAILEVGNAAERGGPDSSAIVHKEGMHVVVWQSTASLAVNRSVPVIPSVQARTCSKPNTAISGRQYGPNVGTRQTLLDRNRGDREISKVVEAITGRNPNSAFTILEEPINEIAREAIRPRKQIRPPLVQMQQAPIRSDP